MVFNKATLIKRMGSKDKRFKELDPDEQDSIIQDGINYLQDHTKWFRHFEGYTLQTLKDQEINTIATITNPNGVDTIMVTKDGEPYAVQLDVQINRNDNYSIGIGFYDDFDYTDCIIEIVWYLYPSVNDTIDTNSNMLELIKFASYMKMYEEFEDTDRESRNKARFDELLGTGSLNIINEFQDFPMKNFN